MSGAVNQTRTAGFLAFGLLVAGLGVLFVGERVVVDPDVAMLVRGLSAVAIGVGFALRLRDWRGATGEHRRVEGRLTLAYGAVIDALIIYALSTPGGLGLLGLAGESADRWSDLLTVAWLVVFAVAFGALLFMELAYSRMPVAEAVEVRRVRGAAEGGISLALVLIFLFSLNYAVAHRDIKRDLSYFRTTAASEATTKLVEQLDKPVRAVLFFPEVSEVREQIEPYFSSLASRSEKFTVEIRDHALEPGLTRKYRVRNNGNVLLLAGLPAGVSLTDGRALQGSGLTSEQFDVGTDLEKARAKLRKLDETFQKHFSKLSKPARSLHLTVGHRERSKTGGEGDGPHDKLRGMHALLKRFNIETHDLGMAQGLANGVPDSAGAVAIIGPREPFLPEEVSALLRYVEGGGRLLVMVDPNVDDGLDPLLAGLALHREKGVVASERHHMRRRFNASDKVYVYSNSYTSHPTVTSCSRNSARVATLVVEGAALTRRSDKAIKGARVTFPFKTSADSWLDVDGDYKRGKSEHMSVKYLAAAVTVGKGDKQGRAVVIGDGGFIDDRLVRNMGNVLQFVDSIRWLIGEESVAGSLDSEEDVPIEHRKDDDLLWFYATTFGMPLPLLGIGLLVGRRRRRGRRSA